MSTLSIKLTSKQIEELYIQYKDYLTDTSNDLITFQIDYNKTIITVYNTNKVVFQGLNTDVFAKKYNCYIDTNNTNNKNNNDINSDSHAGSDESGTGDYFGPVVVVACIVNKTDINFVKELNVDDSKKLQDHNILDIAPKLMNKLTYSVLVLENSHYNKIYNSNNLNAIKAKLHNKAYLNLKDKAKLPSNCIIDQFAPEKTYYKYLINEPEIFKNLIFETKAESKYYAVACASIIARYTLLNHFQLMKKHYNFDFALGGGAQADECAKRFVKQFGYQQLSNVCKLHFKNTKKL